MKIKLKNSSFEEYNNTIIDVELDEAGDAPLPHNIVERTGRLFAFPDEFEVVDESVSAGGYTLVIRANGLIQLHEILDGLPTHVLALAELNKN